MLSLSVALWDLTSQTPRIPVSSADVVTSPWMKVSFPYIACLLSVTLALVVAGPSSIALSITGGYLGLPHPDFLHGTALYGCLGASGFPVLVCFAFYYFLPLLASTYALRFYLSGFQITAFSEYMIRVFFWIPNTCWPCSITWSTVLSSKNCVSRVKELHCPMGFS